MLQTPTHRKIRPPDPRDLPLSPLSDNSVKIAKLSSMSATPDSSCKINHSPQTPKSRRILNAPQMAPRRRAVDFLSDRMMPQISKFNANTPTKSKFSHSSIITRSLAKAFGFDMNSPVLDFHSRRKAKKLSENHTPFKKKVRLSKSGTLDGFIDGFNANDTTACGFQRKAKRRIPSKPDRILDVPDILDDFYLHVLDWSKQHILAVALTNQIYSWNELTGDVVKFFSLDSGYISSLKFSSRGDILAVGDNKGFVRIFNMRNYSSSRHFGQELLALKAPETQSIGHLAWNSKDHLAVAYSDGSIHLFNCDNIMQDAAHVLRPYRMWSGFHSDRIVGMQWDPLDSCAQILVTGGNDNLVIVWNSSQDKPKHILTNHQSAVRALAFCPWQRGGNHDQHIRIFNTETGQCLRSINVGSQVCELIWSGSCRELLSAHTSDQDQLNFWSYPSMEKLHSIAGHSQRPLYMALSPDGQTLASASSDETLKFWKCFVMKTGLKKNGLEHTATRKPATIR